MKDKTTEEGVVGTRILQLIRGRSYTYESDGVRVIVRAENPYFKTDSAKIADALVATGRFLVVGKSDSVDETGTGGKGFEIEELELDKMTVAELDAYAAENGIDIDGLVKKADKLAMIHKALANKSEDDELFVDDNE